MRISDWSSDVCSSDLANDFMEAAQLALQAGLPGEAQQYVTFGYSTKALGTGSEASRQQRLKDLVDKKVAEDKPTLAARDKLAAAQRSEERRVGKECVSTGISRWAP